ncbi:MATE family efflux transporter [Pedobacter insulae]|uniref:hypothetical protein n=1 Tax=Pedobacter insulae TaxID=414048 RepID=UPI00116067BC|nr:hypothetical protein [Pedobacter insulae]
MKNSLIFSLLRYLEYGLVAFSYIIVAKKVGPAEYSKTIPGFLFITYSQYLMLGLNQALIKAYSTEDNEEIRRVYMRNTLYYIFLVSILVVLAGIALLPSEMFVYISLISVMIYFRGVFQTLLRLEDKILGINISNLAFSLTYFVLVFFYTDSIPYFFAAWLISLVFANFFNAFQAFPIINRLGISFNLSNIRDLRNTILPQIKSGVKMTLIGLITTFFLTYDRFILNHFSTDHILKGNYQLADNIAGALYLLLTTILFYYYPIILNKGSKSAEFRVKVVKYGSVGVVLVSLAIIAIGPFFISMLVHFFPSYENISEFLIWQAVLKINILGLGIGSIISITSNKEFFFIKFWLVIVTLVMAILYLTASLVKKNFPLHLLYLEIMMLIVSNAVFLFISKRSLR